MHLIVTVRPTFPPRAACKRQRTSNWALRAQPQLNCIHFRLQQCCIFSLSAVALPLGERWTSGGKSASVLAVRGETLNDFLLKFSILQLVVRRSWVDVTLSSQRRWLPLTVHWWRARPDCWVLKELAATKIIYPTERSKTNKDVSKLCFPLSYGGLFWFFPPSNVLRPEQPEARRLGWMVAGKVFPLEVASNVNKLSENGFSRYRKCCPVGKKALNFRYRIIAVPPVSTGNDHLNEWGGVIDVGNSFNWYVILISKSCILRIDNERFVQF